MYGVCPHCRGIFPIVAGFVGDRRTMVMRHHKDSERGGDCSGTGMEPREWPVGKPYEPGPNDSGSLGGLSEF